MLASEILGTVCSSMFVIEVELQFVRAIHS